MWIKFKEDNPIDKPDYLEPLHAFNTYVLDTLLPTSIALLESYKILLKYIEGFQDDEEKQRLVKKNLKPFILKTLRGFL